MRDFLSELLNIGQFMADIHIGYKESRYVLRLANGLFVVPDVSILKTICVKWLV